MKNARLQDHRPDQQLFAQSVAFDTIAPPQQDFLLYVPLSHVAEPSKTVAAGKNWVRLTLAGQGTIYARPWGDGLCI